MLSVSYAGKNVHSAGKTGALLRGDASGANRCYVVAHCATPPHPTPKFFLLQFSRHSKGFRRENFFQIFFLGGGQKNFLTPPQKNFFNFLAIPWDFEEKIFFKVFFPALPELHLR